MISISVVVFIRFAEVARGTGDRDRIDRRVMDVVGGRESTWRSTEDPTSPVAPVRMRWTMLKLP